MEGHPATGETCVTVFKHDKPFVYTTPWLLDTALYPLQLRVYDYFLPLVELWPTEIFITTHCSSLVQMESAATTLTLLCQYYSCPSRSKLLHSNPEGSSLYQQAQWAVNPKQQKLKNIFLDTLWLNHIHNTKSTQPTFIRAPALLTAYYPRMNRHYQWAQASLELSFQMQILSSCAHSFVLNQSELLVPGEEKENCSKTYISNQSIISIAFILYMPLRYINYIRKKPTTTTKFLLLRTFNIYYNTFWPACPSSGNIKYKILWGIFILS